MQEQEQQPLLPWPCQQNNSSHAAGAPQQQKQPQQQSLFASAANSIYPTIHTQQDALGGSSSSSFREQVGCTAHYPIPGASTRPQQQAYQQQPGWLATPDQALSSHGYSLPHSCYSTSSTTSDPASFLHNFDSLGLGSSTSSSSGGVLTRRYNSSGSTDTADVLSQRYPSCSSSSTTAADASPFGHGHSCCYAQPAGPQPPPTPQQQQQRRHPSRYPSIESSSSSRLPSGAWDSSSSSSSSCGRYPTVPGYTTTCHSQHSSSVLASREGSAASDVSNSRCPALGSSSWDAANNLSQQQHQQQQQQQQQQGQQLKRLDKQQQQQQQQRQQQQRHKLSDRLRHPWRPSGLYPILSGEEAGCQQQQQQQQQNSTDGQAAAATSPWGFDLQVQLQRVCGLPAVADPYVMVLVPLGGWEEEYRTEPQWGTQAVEYGSDEAFDLANIQPGCTLRCEVWDKNLSQDVMIGRASWSLADQLQGPTGSSNTGAAAAAVLDVSPQPDQGNNPCAAAAAEVCLELRDPTKSSKATGALQFKVLWRASQQAGAPHRVGPVRFRQHYCRTAGLFTGQWSTDETRCYSTYKLFLCGTHAVFGGVRMRWNAAYDKARLIFKPVPVLGTPVAQVIKHQHSAMYATQTGPSRGGVLRSAADFFHLFSFGVRGGELRFYTYTLCSDCFRCSETGTDFGTDFVSKHAMHAGGAEEVLYAGEFCIMRCDQAVGGHKLVLDNNSGTYAPHKSKLPLMQQLFTLNFPDMEVEVLDRRDPKLEYYQSLCPSRARGGAAAAAAATVAASSAATGRAQQFLAA